MWFSSFLGHIANDSGQDTGTQCNWQAKLMRPDSGF